MTSLIEELKKELKEVKAPRITKWKRDPLPVKCAPGEAIICDRYGNGAMVIEARAIMLGDSASVCMPPVGIERGPMLFGSHLHQLSSGETLVLQFTPYPKTRDEDGMPCVCKVVGDGIYDEGKAFYPNVGRNIVNFKEVDGTFFYINHPAGLAMYQKATGQEPVNYQAVAPKPLASAPKRRGRPRKVEPKNAAAYEDADGDVHVTGDDAA